MYWRFIIIYAWFHENSTKYLFIKAKHHVNIEVKNVNTNFTYEGKREKIKQNEGKCSWDKTKYVKKEENKKL